MRIKYFVVVAVLATAILCSGGVVKAATVQDIMNQIAALQAQLMALQGQPSVTVTSPNGGEQWVAGSTHNITWSATGLSSYPMSIWISNSSTVSAVFGQMVGSVPAGTNSYSWTIPSSLSGNYWIGVFAVTGSTVPIPGYYDISNASFNIVAPGQDNSALIDQLLAQIQALQAQLAQLQTQQGTTPPVIWCHNFTKNLGYAQSGSSEVSQLHTALDKEGISYAPDTSNQYAGPTMNAVAQFQTKYGILQTGYFGLRTRIRMNELYGCKTTTQPSITVTSPNGGEVWVQGSTHDITWNTSSCATASAFDIYLYDNRLSGTHQAQKMIASVVPCSLGRYSWSVGSFWTVSDSGASALVPVSNNFKIQLRGIAGAAELIDESDNYFSIVAPTISYPYFYMSVDKSAYLLTDTMSLTMSRAGGSIAPYPVDLYIQGVNSDSKVLVQSNLMVGVDTVKTIKLNNYISAAGFYIALICDAGKICNGGVNTNAVSFTVTSSTTQPSITVTSPNGGESYKIGDQIQVSFSAFVTSNPSEMPRGGLSYYISFIRPDGTEDQMFTGLIFANGVQGAKVVIPSGPIGNYKIKVYFRAYGLNYQDRSDNYFSIVSPGNLSTGCISTSGYSTTTGQSCRNSTPSITVTSPNGGEMWYVNTLQSIRWTCPSNSASASFSIKLYNGADRSLSSSYRIITSSIPCSSQNYTWAVPSDIPAGNNYKIQLYGAGEIGLIDESDNYFRIMAPTITVPTVAISASPSSISAGQSSTLTWSSANAVSCTASNGWTGVKSLTGTQVVSPTTNTQYVLICSGPSGSGAMASGSAWVNVGTPAPSISSISPASVIQGQTINLTISGSNLSGVPISSCGLNPSALGGFILGNCIAQSSSISLQLTAADNVTAGQRQFTIATPSGTSNAIVFTVSPRQQPTSGASITVTSPNGGEVWKILETHNITWSATNGTGNSVTIKLFKAGNLSKIISSSVPNTGSFTWTIPITYATNTNDYKVTVTDNSDGNVYDSSDNYFKIAAAPITSSVTQDSLASISAALQAILRQILEIYVR